MAEQKPEFVVRLSDEGFLGARKDPLSNTNHIQTDTSHFETSTHMLLIAPKHWL